jgi:hypothetical protein
MSVAKKVIAMKLSVRSIKDAITELETYRDSIDAKMDKLLEKLAYIGVKEASVRFTTAIYDGVNDSSVTLEPTKDGYCIKAEGRAVAFIEFGAGVYHNPGEPYPNPRPAGIVGIGEYGKGMGKRQAWGYKDDSGELVITHGNPAAMPMWYASEEMRDAILTTFKEVFG